MFSETAHSSQTKLIGQSLPIGEHGILPLQSIKAKKKADIQFLALETTRRSKNLELAHKYEKVSN